MKAKRKAGFNRDYWRIREFLERNGYGVVSFANELGVSRALVSSTINGRKNSPTVLAALIEAGCPVKYLDLPEAMKEAV